MNVKDINSYTTHCMLPLWLTFGYKENTIDEQQSNQFYNVKVFDLELKILYIRLAIKVLRV
jgi:hypothetical protein